jgi:hypothetical protein
MFRNEEGRTLPNPAGKGAGDPQPIIDLCVANQNNGADVILTLRPGSAFDGAILLGQFVKQQLDGLHLKHFSTSLLAP